MTIAQEVADYKRKLASQSMWAIRGLLAIFSAQTADEQCSDSTTADNGVGFTGIDANFLSSLAKQAQRKIDWVASKNLKLDYSMVLSGNQMTHLFKKMPKYAKQLHNAQRAKAEVAPVVAEVEVEEVALVVHEIPHAIQIREMIRGSCGDQQAEQWYEEIH